ncbi:MAG: 50S ribosomal protein L25 [Candidatus Gracilibacteria bacterium]|nr:50S ribosomal protein L25 [Candidatus Gracilibacteria bacterium]
MEKLNLAAEVRSTSEKLSEVRSAKKVPAVVYGHNIDNVTISVNNSDFLRTFRQSGESHIITLDIDGKKVDVLVHDLQREPVSGDFLHIDFFAITKGESLQTKIHLNFIGTSSAVKEGAILEEHLKELEVKCLPADLCDGFDVDLSLLENMGDMIRVSDLKISDKYTVVTNSNDLIASAAKPKKAEEVSNEAPEAPVTEEEKEA